MMNAEEARNLILARMTPGSVKTIALENSHGTVLAEDVSAGMDLPSFDNAAMDGYAVRSEDIRNVPVSLRLIGEVPAGASHSARLSIGEACAIMTGAKIPDGADAIVQVEWTTGAIPGEVTVNKVVDRGQNIRRRGSEVAAGKPVLSKGALLRPQEIGLLATLGCRFIQVYSMPRVAILTTGNELVGLDGPLKEGEIRNSNAFTLSTLVNAAGAEATFIGVAKDNDEDVRKLLRVGLTHDVLITSGGVSVGKYDLVSSCLRDEGVEILVDRVRIKPGMPFIFGLRGKVPVFGLPGNPVSAMVTFLQFVRPGLRALAGESNPGRRFMVPAYLSHDIKKTDGKRHFVRAIVEREGDRFTVRQTGHQGSAMMTSLTAANCLLVLPENREDFRNGELVDVEMLP